MTAVRKLCVTFAVAALHIGTSRKPAKIGGHVLGPSPSREGSAPPVTREAYMQVENIVVEAQASFFSQVLAGQLALCHMFV